jgi:hypothetical protein
MADNTTQSLILKALGWAYDTGLTGLPKLSLDSSQQVAEQYSKEPGTTQERANSLIRAQIYRAGAAGLLTGFGGLATLPIGVASDLASTYFFQLRMIEAIAIMGDYDVHSQQVRMLSFVSMCGSAAAEIATDIGVSFGEKLTPKMLANISAKVAVEVEEKAAARIVVRVGEDGLLHAGRLIPGLGGLLLGGINAYMTNQIGDVARDLFLPR